MSGRKAGAVRVQQGHNQYSPHRAEKDSLEDVILAKTGIVCSVKVTPDLVKINAPSYSDYILAKAAIKDQVSAEIVRA